MNNYSFNCKPKFFLVILLIGFNGFAAAQQLASELHTKLSSSDQQKIKKANDLYVKGQKLENEMQPLNKEDKKLQLKWLGASNYYKEANSIRENIYSDNIQSFWKKYTGEKKYFEYAKKVELASADSFKKANQLRSVADKERKFPEKMALIVKAEKLEGRSLVMMQKVLYTYLSWPVEYEHVWVSTDDQLLPNPAKNQPRESTDNKTVFDAKAVNTTVPKKDSTINKDTASKKGPVIIRPKPTMILVKPKSVAGATVNKPVKSETKDTIAKVSSLPAISNKQASNTLVADKPKVKDSITKKEPVLVTESTDLLKDTTKIIPIAKNSPVPVLKPIVPVKDTLSKKATVSQAKTALVPMDTKKGKVKEVVVGNDSSLYGRVQVKEDQIDKFNDFLKQKYPSKMEDYVINFQELNYSDVNSLREAWYRYQYGYLTQDSAALLAANQDSVSKGQKGLIASNMKTEDLTGKTNAKQGTKEDKKILTPETRVSVTKSNKEGTIKSGAKTSKPAESKSIATATEGFIFRVQIAACRVRLDETTLRSIYNGSNSIMELNEDGWHKYAIGEFATYKYARQLRDQSNIPGVFVIAYLNGKRIKITPAIAYKKFSVKTNIASLDPSQIRYYIQIVASKTLLSDNYINNMYNGPNKIDVFKEGDWNKYLVLAGKTFKEADVLLKKISVPGAFILAYHKGSRIEVQTAIQLTQ